MFNHKSELNSKDFLKKYLIKRFMRLYKPYVGFSLLIVLYLSLVIFIFKKSNITYGLYILDDAPTNILLRFLIGDNPFSHKLWYLVVLFLITAICIVVIYIWNIHILFKLTPLICALSLIYWGTLSMNNIGKTNIKLYLIMYFVIFVIGIFFAYVLDNKLFQRLIFMFSMLFILLFAFTCLKHINESLIYKYLFYLYGFTLPSFAILICRYLTRMNTISVFLSYIGKNSFYIYLFHTPLVLPTITKVFADLPYITYFSPILATSATCLVSILIYRLLSIFKVNRLIE